MFLSQSAHVTITAAGLDTGSDTNDCVRNYARSLEDDGSQVGTAASDHLYA
jgi:hypothetical protein